MPGGDHESDRHSHEGPDSDDIGRLRPFDYDQESETIGAGSRAPGELPTRPNRDT